MSNTFGIILAVFAAGCMGGLANAAIAGELQLPHKDPEAKVFRPGWIGNVVVGGLAALVFWGLYGPMSGVVLIGPRDPGAVTAVLRVSELFGSLLTGVGGGRLLSAAVDRRISDREKSALTQAKDQLAEAVKNLAQEVEK